MESDQCVKEFLTINQSMKKSFRSYLGWLNVLNLSVRSQFAIIVMIIIIFKNLYIVTEIKQIVNYAYIVER